MKQKYAILRDDAKKELVVKEYAELDKEILSLLCQETYAVETIKAEIDKGKDGLIASLRTHNMYPPYIFADRIADAVINVLSPEGPSSAELFFDDKEFFIKPPEEDLLIEDEEEDVDDTSETIDDLLGDEIDKKGIDNLKTSLKVAEDAPVDTEDEK